MEQFVITLSYISILSVLIPMGVYLIYPSHEKISFLMSILIMVSFTADIANELYIRSGHMGYIIMNIYFVIQFFLLCMVYQNILQEKTKIIGAIWLFMICWLINTIFLQGINEYQSYARLLGGIILVIFSVVCYYRMFRNPITDKRMNLLVLWVNMGVLFYFFFNLYLFGMSNYVLKNMFRNDAMIVWGFHNVNNIVKNVLFAIGLFEAGRKLSDSNAKNLK